MNSMIPSLPCSNLELHSGGLELSAEHGGESEYETRVDRMSVARDEVAGMKLPSRFTTVRAVGRVASTTLSADYRPSPMSGRRQAFARELELLAEAERDVLVASADVLL